MKKQTPPPAPNQSPAAYPPAWLGWSMWGLGAILYLAGFFQRVAPAVMTAELMAEFSLSAAALGNLSAFYFYSYVAMQIPTGILADSWGPRKLLFAGALTAGLGSLLFGLAPNVLLANLGRLLIGASVGVAWVVMMKLAVHWLPAVRFALVSGIGLLAGVTGAVFGGVPLRMLVMAFGWRPAMVVAGLLTLALAAAILVFVRNDPGLRGFRSYAPDLDGQGRTVRKISPLKGLVQVLKIRNVVLLSLAPGGLVGPVLAFAGLWGVPYLKARYGLAQTEAAAVCSALMICWALGAPIAGALSEKVGGRKALYLGGALISFFGWLVMLYLPGLPLTAFLVLTVITGLGAGVVVVGFAFGKESTPPQLAGTTAGSINMGVMLGPMVLQPAIGAVLDLVWRGDLENGVRIYRVESFQTAFSLMAVWALLACVMALFTEETHCKQQA